MIDSLRGILLSKDHTSAVIEVAGVGYRMSMSTRALSGLPGVGEKVFVHTFMSVRDEGISLYGFCDERERLLFNQLTSVSGIGPKVALAVLSTFSPDAFAQAVAEGDVARVATTPGIGKKMAQRIVLELKGPIESLLGGSSLFDALDAAESAGRSEAVDALLAMGFSSAETQLALRGYDGDAADTAGAVRYALRKLGTKL